MRALSRVVSAESPVPYASKLRSASPALAAAFGQRGGMDRTAQLEQYGEIGTLFGIVSKLATAVSLVDWKLWRSAASGLPEDRVEVTGKHQALNVWRKPNPFMTRTELVEGSQQHVDLTGEGWWVVNRVGSVPTELWPIRPDRIFPIPSVRDFIVGYVYVSPDGEEVPLRREDVIMIRWPSPLDIYRGQGPLSALSGDIANDANQRAWSESFFRNSASPGGVIETGGRLGDDEFDELVNRWERSHRGVSNAGRVAILEQGKFVPLSYTQKDMQFVETRGFTKQALLDAYGMPKFGIGDVDDVNRATAEASKAWFAESLTIPRLERIKQALNNDFLPMFGTTSQGLEFDYEDPVPPDTETENATLTARVQAVVALINTGRVDPASVAEAFELPDSIVWKEPEPQPQPALPPAQGGDPNGAPADGRQRAA